MPNDLKQFSLFEDFASSELAAVHALLESQEFSSGAFVFREGDPGDALFLIVDGIAEVLAGKTLVQINTMDPGDGFGEMALIDGLPRSASVRALTKLKLFRLGSVHFFQLFQNQPLLAQRVLKRLTGRMRAITNRLQTRVEELAESRCKIVEGYDETIALLSKALDLRDHETEGHSVRVTEYTIRLAVALGYPAEWMQALKMGALLHDVGKIGVPDAILRKPGKLSEEEFETIKRHPVWGYEMLKEIDFLSGALPVILHHHEKFDGSGYPDGLKGSSIPYAARIFAVIDAFDALTSDRPYRKAASRESALAELERCSGAHFDPEIVVVFRREFYEA